MIPPGTMLHEIRAAHPRLSEAECLQRQAEMVLPALQRQAARLRMGVTHSIAAPEYLAAHEAWEIAWTACVGLKRQHAPAAAPIAEWTPLAEACDAAAERYKAAWSAELRRQRALDANPGTI